MTNATSKLSKLQKFILLEAAKCLPGLDERARTLTKMSVAFNPEAKPFEVSQFEHITRTQILVGYFGFKMRKAVCFGGETDDHTEQISRRDVDPARYNTANAALYRAINRLEKRGLLMRMLPQKVGIGYGRWELRKRRGNMQLTEQGILAAAALVRDKSP
jgi:hypothetical protein